MLRQALRRQRRRPTATVSSDGGVLRALESEIEHELSSSSSSSASLSDPSLTLRGFKLEWDNPMTQDVLLLADRGGGNDEEIAVSAKLAQPILEDVGVARWAARVKVLVKKCASDPVMHFHCNAFNPVGSAGVDFSVKAVRYHPSCCILEDCKAYNGRVRDFRAPSPELLKASKDFLLARGITADLMGLVMQHLRAKEQLQYVNWLHSMKHIFSADDDLDEE